MVKKFTSKQMEPKMNKISQTSQKQTNKEDMFLYEFNQGPRMGQCYEHHVMWIEAGIINSGGDDKVEHGLEDNGHLH